jgi:hypothetical protein
MREGAEYRLLGVLFRVKAHWLEFGQWQASYDIWTFLVEICIIHWKLNIGVTEKSWDCLEGYKISVILIG